MKGRDRQAELDAVVKIKYEKRARPLAPLLLGSHVRVRDPTSKLWDKVVMVVSIVSSSRAAVSCGAIGDCCARW